MATRTNLTQAELLERALQDTAIVDEIKKATGFDLDAYTKEKAGTLPNDLVVKRPPHKLVDPSSNDDKRRDSAIYKSNRFVQGTSAKAFPEPPRPEQAQTSHHFKTLTINGLTINVKTVKNTAVHSTACLISPTDRGLLDADKKISFLNSATKWVLAKNNKLSLPVLGKDVKTSLSDIRNHTSQIAALHRHMITYGIDAGMTLVDPIDVENKPDLEPKSGTFNVLEDYRTLHPAQVANSNAWFNLWCDSAEVRENLSIQQTLLHNNCSESLWNKCLQEFNCYHAYQQGGPLMALLILKRISATSETAISNVLTQIKSLKIRDIPGEDIEDVVALVQSARNLLVGASTEGYNYMPSDFPKTLLEMMQTSSVAKFNKVFADKLEAATREADEQGKPTEWPDLEAISTLAKNTYKRLESEWVKSADQKALTATSTTSTTASDGKRPFKCWNCGTDCGQRGGAEKCTAKPIDTDRIAKNKKAFLDAKKKRREQSGRSGNSSKPLRITGSGGKFQGKPLILNKNCVYILDSKEIQRQQEKEDHKTLREASEKLVAMLEFKDNDSTSTEAASSSSYNVSNFRAALAKCKPRGSN